MLFLQRIISQICVDEERTEVEGENIRLAVFGENCHSLTLAADEIAVGKFSDFPRIRVNLVDCLSFIICCSVERSVVKLRALNAPDGFRAFWSGRMHTDNRFRD